MQCNFLWFAMVSKRSLFLLKQEFKQWVVNRHTQLLQKKWLSLWKLKTNFQLYCVTLSYFHKIKMAITTVDLLFPLIFKTASFIQATPNNVRNPLLIFENNY